MAYRQFFNIIRILSGRPGCHFLTVRVPNDQFRADHGLSVRNVGFGDLHLCHVVLHDHGLHGQTVRHRKQDRLSRGISRSRQFLRQRIISGLEGIDRMWFGPGYPLLYHISVRIPDRQRRSRDLGASGYLLLRNTHAVGHVLKYKFQTALPVDQPVFINGKCLLLSLRIISVRSLDLQHGIFRPGRQLLQPDPSGFIRRHFPFLFCSGDPKDRPWQRISRQRVSFEDLKNRRFIFECSGTFGTFPSGSPVLISRQRNVHGLHHDGISRYGPDFLHGVLTQIKFFRDGLSVFPGRNFLHHGPGRQRYRLTLCIFPFPDSTRQIGDILFHRYAECKSLQIFLRLRILLCHCDPAHLRRFLGCIDKRLQKTVRPLLDGEGVILHYIISLRQCLRIFPDRIGTDLQRVRKLHASVGICDPAPGKRTACRIKQIDLVPVLINTECDSGCRYQLTCIRVPLLDHHSRLDALVGRCKPVYPAV